MTPETRNCQNCKKDFTIESEDFNFYEKIKVPLPTFCSWCRFIRRMAYRNDRTLYKRKCDMCSKDLIASYSKNVPFPVYCRECYYGDGWDPLSFGIEVDINKNFFEQYKELSSKVPRVAVWQINCVNSEYSNNLTDSRNIYLSFSVTKGSENVFYSKNVDSSREIVDCLNVINGGEGLYENIEAQGNYNSQYLFLSRNCIDSYYLIDCANCTNCFLSHNLRNKQFCIRNQQYSREDYFRELEKMNLHDKSSRELLAQEFQDIKLKAIYKFSNVTKSVGSTGNNLLNTKECLSCFDVYNTENSKYLYRTYDNKDCMDFDYGTASELLYECAIGMLRDYNTKFSTNGDSVSNGEYTESCINSSDIFGCIGIRNKKYVILNKEYSADDYYVLRTKIIQNMIENPYKDAQGLIYRYGEFFPIEISPRAYNETFAQELAPLTKEEALEKGYNWSDLGEKNINITIYAQQIPGDIRKVDESILGEVLECIHREQCVHNCSGGFRITKGELQFYQKRNIPLPTKCPNCRYYERLKYILPRKLWHGKCRCDLKDHNHPGPCLNKFETSYAPDRPEKVYCESCYNKEVY